MASVPRLPRIRKITRRVPLIAPPAVAVAAHHLHLHPRHQAVRQHTVIRITHPTVIVIAAHQAHHAITLMVSVQEQTAAMDESHVALAWIKEAAQ
ncbi:MAG: hypothetical protein WEA04_04130 [Candidatus Andersenbacteria bacterium]